jgi:teichuronic acid biosynthesis glycosyltransferase TuaC
MAGRTLAAHRQGIVVRVLVFSNLYPNARRPNYAVFVEQRVRRVAASGVPIRVVAPIPWFPGGYRSFVDVPRSEERFGLRIDHPRYLMAPGIGMSIQPLLMALATAPLLQRLRAEFPFDVIDAHYGYPDGVAAYMLARWFDVPVIVTARGTDLHLLPRYAAPRLWLSRTLPRCDAVIGVSEALRRAAIELGVDPDRALTVRNGVDLEIFRPLAREGSRKQLGVEGPLMLSIGHLIERKGNHIILEALKDMPEWRLVVIGEGEERNRLERLIAEWRLADRVRLIGEVPHSELPAWYSAADVLVLPSSREGVPNVVLEAMACGTPVVATNVGGTAEVVNCPEAGVVMRDRSADSVRKAIAALLVSRPAREATRWHAEQFSWEATTSALLRLFGEIDAARQAAAVRMPA